MKFFILLFYLFNIFLVIINAYKIPNIDFEILNDGFKVSIPDEPGVQAVFYIMEIDDTCPPLMDYITEVKDNSWASIQRTNLNTNDKVEISILVQYNDIIYEKTETKIIFDSRLLTTRKSESKDINSTNSKCQEFLKIQQDLKPCKPAQTTVGKQQRTCQGDLLFEENFDNGTSVNTTIWKHDVRQRMYHVEEELVAFDDNKRNCLLEDGVLHIVPYLADTDVHSGVFQLGDKCTAVENPMQECNVISGRLFYIKPPVYSAQIHTRNSFSFKYGRVEIRAKLPKGDWLFPYLMLQPINTYAETHFARQLRVAYARGNANLRSIDNEDISGNHLYGGAIIWQNGRATQFTKSKLAKRHFGDDFHVYTMVWQPQMISWFVDGELYGEIYDGVELFNEQCFIILGLTVGGFLNFDDNVLKPNVKPYRNREPKAALLFWQSRDTWAPTWGNDRALQIDYVRVYAE